jgi:hypothetical protein
VDENDEDEADCLLLDFFLGGDFDFLEVEMAADDDFEGELQLDAEADGSLSNSSTSILELEQDVADFEDDLGRAPGFLDFATFVEWPFDEDVEVDFVVDSETLLELEVNDDCLPEAVRAAAACLAASSARQMATNSARVRGATSASHSEMYPSSWSE